MTAMVFFSSCEPPVPGVLKSAAITLALLVVFPGNLAAQGLPTETGSHFPIALWFVGAGVLGLVLAYGIFRNSSRTGAEKQATEHATKRRYAEEERDRVRSGSE
jgi:hypothetical protein